MEGFVNLKFRTNLVRPQKYSRNLKKVRFEQFSRNLSTNSKLDN